MTTTIIHVYIFKKYKAIILNKLRTSNSYVKRVQWGNFCSQQH